MSRRAAAPSAEEQRVASLRQLAASAGNLTCLECAQRGPTYVDVTLGAFVCSRCSGLLRGLTPPHRVKSISMATFTAEEIALIKSRGNDYCRSIWMALYEGEQPVLKDEQSLKDFMSEKYEKKRYYMEANANDRLKFAKETPVVAAVTTPTSAAVRDNGIWNSTTTSRPTVRSFSPTDHFETHMTFNFPTTHIATTAPSNPTSDFSKFPVDFNSADIFNSSQLNNNFAMTSPPSQNMDNSFANLNANANTVTQDRYAALADLDLTLRQQNQTQHNDNDIKSTPNFNPFEGSSYSSESRNPFRSSQQNNNMNGNVHYYSNPFIMGPNATPSGQSKNPFL